MANVVCVFCDDNYFPVADILCRQLAAEPGRNFDGSIAWPAVPEAACVAMLMCANERALSAERQQRLIEQIRRVPGCGEP